MGLHLLGDLPGLFGVAGGLGAAEEVSGAGEAQALFIRRGLGLGVDGREHDALRRLGEQLLLEDAALQAFDGRRFPGLVRRGGEFIEGHRSQRFGVRFGIHHNILSSMIYHYRRGVPFPFPPILPQRRAFLPDHAQKDSTGGFFAFDPRVLICRIRAALLGADDLRFTASILAHGFPLGCAFPRDSQWPLRLRSHSQQRDCSGFSPDSLQPKTVFICIYYATVSQGKSQLFYDGIPCKISDEPQLTGTEKPRIIYLY